jgi:hypothetical protein
MFAEDKADMPRSRDARLVNFRVNNQIRKIGIIVKLTGVIKPASQSGFVEGGNSASTEAPERFTSCVKGLNSAPYPGGRKDDRVHRLILIRYRNWVTSFPV